MTVPELLRFFNDTYGIGHQWPLAWEVDKDTYINVCNHVFKQKEGIMMVDKHLREIKLIRISVDVNGNGVYLKDVRIVCKDATS